MANFFSKVGSVYKKGFELAAGGIGYQQYKRVKAQRDRGRSYIEDAYASASQRQSTHEGDVRQGERESLNARGLLTPGSNTGASLTAAAYAPRTLGTRMQADTNRELGLERSDLDHAHTRAVDENKAEYLNNLINTGVGDAKMAAGIYTGGQTMGAFSAMPSAPSGAPAPAFQGLMDGGSLIQGAYGDVQGAFGIHPLTGRPQGTQHGVGQPNYDFNVG